MKQFSHVAGVGCGAAGGLWTFLFAEGSLQQFMVLHVPPELARINQDKLW